MSTDRGGALDADGAARAVRSARLAGGGLRRLLVGFDGSEAAEHALELAAALATAADGELLIVLCGTAHTLADISFDSLLTDATNAEGLTAVVRADLAGRFDGTGLRWRFERLDDSAGDALTATAVRWDADAVVVGRSGARFPRSVLGSVATHLTRHCDRPVLIVP